MLKLLFHFRAYPNNRLVMRPARTGLFCHLRFGFVESFGFSTELLSALEFTHGAGSSISLPGALLTSSFEIPCSIFDIHSMSILCLESRVLISVKIGKNSARNQSKALIPKSKNQIF